MRWTPYQMRVIEALRAGERLHYMTGIDAHYFIGNVKPRPTQATVDKLKQGNMITLIRSDWRGSTWRLSPPPDTRENEA